ncbi:MAG: serine/threonine protein kinase, partial [Polyangiaceae bacterium]|nr:serine/threonine protein kinase [Polyangiaceae bacterium]
FEREAHALAAVSHPNIVAVTDYGIHGEFPYLVMERLEGRNLASVLEDRGLLPVEHAATLMRQILAGLGHAHARGLVHRDLKPGNVWVESHAEAEHVKLLDFGFAKFVEGEEAAALTAVGMVVGTLSYMSPEQAMGGAIDHRSDIYSAGVLLFEMLTGTRPFDGEPVELLRAHISKAPPTLAEARPGRSFPPALEAIVKRALEKKPDARWQSAVELSKALERMTTPEDDEPKTLIYTPPAGAALDVDDDKTIVTAEATARSAPFRPKKPELSLRTEDLASFRLTDKPPLRIGGGAQRPRGAVLAAAGIGVVALVLAGFFALRGDASGPDPSSEPSADETLARTLAEEAPIPESDPWALLPREASL